MRGKRLSERTMSHAKLDMLIDYYLGDMERRGCTQDSVATNRKALRRFRKHVDPDARQFPLTEVSDETVEALVTGLQHRTVRWEDHPRRNQEAEPQRADPSTPRVKTRDVTRSARSRPVASAEQRPSAAPPRRMIAGWPPATACLPPRRVARG
jgi:hypothetical protein